MLTNIASQSAPRVRPLQMRACGSKLLGPVGISLLKAHHHQQTRAYRHGMWSSYLDPQCQQDMRRRHRAFKYKYAESLHRRLSWDQHPLTEDSKAAFRRVVGRYWFPSEARYGSRFVNTDEGVRNRKRKTSSDDTGADDGSADTSSNQVSWGGYDSWKSQLNDMVNEAKGRKNTATQASSVEEEYVIDPISNRKVLKKAYGEGDAPMKTFKSYRSQFAAFAPPEAEEQGQTDPVHSNGPPPVEELDKYKEVDMEPLPTQDSPDSGYEDLPRYSTAQTDKAQDSARQSEEYALNHLPPEETVEVYEDLHKYEPSQYDEVRYPSEEPVQKYEDLDKYRPYRHNEETAVEKDATQAYDDLDKYRPYMHNENAEVEQSIPPYDDLKDYGTFDRQEDVKVDESAPQYEDLDKYRPGQFLDDYQIEDADLVQTVAYEDLDKYQQPFHHEEGKTHMDSSSTYHDLHKYEPTDFNDVPSAEEAQPFQQYGDLDKYKAFKSQESEGKAILENDSVSDYLREYDTKSEARETLRQSMNSHIAASDAADKEASANVQMSRQRNKSDGKSNLTGNFVRDFPEEFSKTWSSSTAGLQPQSETDPWGYDTSPRGLETAYEQEMQTNAQSADGSEAEADFYSRRTEGLETVYVVEAGPESSGSPYVKTYGNDLIENMAPITSETTSKLAVQNVTQATAGTSAHIEPTVYKILAYDATLQSISIAETTSGVPDQASPLTPTEVLLRLSHPTKFFSHFAPLQAQGFEIVSGSGDVLVFRKVRESTANTETRSHPINPIDMMGKPAVLPNAAAFASPTGFVNYDVPPVEEQSPPFRSNIDVRREEPVFSGPKTSSPQGDGKQKKKRSVGKRLLIGGAWVAGISYALGVVGEYFATGGIDGKGNTGL
ncbi:hypothetical protein BJ170DRAFT_575996 [Xylariales sp. AK1849]|nr:hypothetical protein BJ170DRAFT_575996 [Xylariales sp. AK1849]